jgi:hypothetical protein
MIKLETARMIGVKKSVCQNGSKALEFLSDGQRSSLRSTK